MNKYDEIFWKLQNKINRLEKQNKELKEMLEELGYERRNEEERRDQ